MSTSTAAHHTLTARVPSQAAGVDARYSEYVAGIPDGPAKANGIQVGDRVAATILGLRTGDGLDNQIPYVQPPPGPGVFEPVAPTPPVDVVLTQVRPLTFRSPSRFRPDGPTRLGSHAYARDLAEVQALGRADSAVRTPAQTEVARFWSENTFTQWGRNLRRLAPPSASVSATAPGSWPWPTPPPPTPSSAASTPSTTTCAGGRSTPSPAPTPTATRTPAPIRPGRLLTVNHPEYPSAHGCWTTALAHALGVFFGADRGRLTVDSAVTATSRSYRSLPEVVREVRLARIAGGLHYRHSMRDGERLGRRIAQHVTRHHFRPTSGARPGPARP